MQQRKRRIQPGDWVRWSGRTHRVTALSLVYGTHSARLHGHPDWVPVKELERIEHE